VRELAGLETLRLGRGLVLLEEVDSTNSYLKDNAEHLPHGAVVLAERQVRGKGRLGRSWSHQAGQSLAFSLLLKEGVRAEYLPGLPFLAGLGVCRGLGALSGADFAIKWSNDVLHGEKKICGVLCESRMAYGQKNPFAVIGMGVNLTQSREELDRLDLVYAQSLILVTGIKYTAAQTAAAILNELEPLWDRFREHGFPAIREEYRSVCVTLGRQVRIMRGCGETEALARDIARDGSLICTLPGGETVHVNAGEASVRGLYGYV